MGSTKFATFCDTLEFPVTASMVNGSVTFELRAAVTGYLLRLWNIDCSPDHSLTGAQYHLALRNPEALYAVDNANLSPGLNSNGNNIEKCFVQNSSIIVQRQFKVVQ